MKHKQLLDIVDSSGDIPGTWDIRGYNTYLQHIGGKFPFLTTTAGKNGTDLLTDEPLRSCLTLLFLCL